jgi:hypothetical protein
VWYCTSETLPSIPGWLSKTDDSEPLLGIRCVRATAEEVGLNDYSVARLFRLLLRLAEP